VVLDILPELLKHYQVIHQTGETNLKDVENRSRYLLAETGLQDKYHAFGHLGTSALQMLGGAAALIISRAGSFIFEIAHWGVPAIIIPIPEEVSHDQRSNAFAYARSGGAVVIEQNNLTASVLLSEINRILSNQKLQEQMRAGAKNFSNPNAARAIAEELMRIALEHESANA
jgi:UDP-N-acetylglucosamine--N-acetylmuramyl-(pentapeptide) pyrophosphoryl-undecaprenol N-acetylglucosamine transferase